MRLNELMAEIDGEYHNMRDIDILNMEFDSRRVIPGTLYIALKGERFDGHDFIPEAVRKGAVALVTQRYADVRAPQVVVRDTRQAMGVLGRRFYTSVRKLDTIGITGTNGKTTTAFLVHSILSEAGRKPGMVGTIHYIIGEKRIKAVRTTPESLDVFKMLEACHDQGARAVVMEVSSHALSLKRVDELQFRAAVFTNISQDHLDFHGTMDAYKQSKLHLFDLLLPDGVAVYNVDDETSMDIRERTMPGCVTYGMIEPADVQAGLSRDTMEGVVVDIAYRGSDYRVASSLVGTYNAYNIAAAFATGVALGIRIDTIIKGIESLKTIRGRMERVIDNIFVDYAHTPRALEHALQALRTYTEGRLIVVFGCGGDRDHKKRPLMGAIASRLSDLAIVTTDNPRSEPPRQIIEDIIGSTDRMNFRIIPDRREAIAYAVTHKHPDDVVLVAGKGHEDYQITGDRVITFDDAEVVRACFENS
jgi:UDP-N-acetylmuramoyl-L-alanyl-D-glutamate--2,6-diaminopimelate ligase